MAAVLAIRIRKGSCGNQLTKQPEQAPVLLGMVLVYRTWQRHVLGPTQVPTFGEGGDGAGGGVGAGGVGGALGQLQTSTVGGRPFPGNRPITW